MDVVAFLKRIAKVLMERAQQAKIKDAVIKRKVLGGNTELRREPDNYAQSPLIKHIKKHCKSPCTIYVAYVPNNNGKTTACYACMDKYTRRGIAFSPEPSKHDGTYFDFMVESLGYKSEATPRGLITRILDELRKDDPKANPQLRSNFLILDNFMPRGYNPEDCSLLHYLIAHIKEKDVTAVILTPNRDAACRLIAQHSLGTVVPLAPVKQLCELRCANRTIDPNEPLDFDWENEVSMVWDKGELKKALEHSPDFLELDAAKQATIRKSFDDVYNELSQDEQNAANPHSIAGAFDEMKTKHSSPPKITTPTNVGCGWDSIC